MRHAQSTSATDKRMTESVLLTLILRFIRRYTSFPYKIDFIGQLAQNRKIMACQNNQCAALLLLKKQISHHFYAVCIPVSYTHLDVYKRQALGYAWLRGDFADFERGFAHSGTFRARDLRAVHALCGAGHGCGLAVPAAVRHTDAIDTG